MPLIKGSHVQFNEFAKTLTKKIVTKKSKNKKSPNVKQTIDKHGHNYAAVATKIQKL